MERPPREKESYGRYKLIKSYRGHSHTKLGSVEIQNMIVVKCHCERPMLFTLDASRKCIQIIQFIQCMFNISFFVHYSFSLEPHRNFPQRKKDWTQDCAQISTSICSLGTAENPFHTEGVHVIESFTDRNNIPNSFSTPDIHQDAPIQNAVIIQKATFKPFSS